MSLFLYGEFEIFEETAHITTYSWGTLFERRKWKGERARERERERERKRERKRETERARTGEMCEGLTIRENHWAILTRKKVTLLDKQQFERIASLAS